MDEDIDGYDPQQDLHPRDPEFRRRLRDNEIMPKWVWALLVILCGMAVHHFWTFNIQG